MIKYIGVGFLVTVAALLIGFLTEDWNLAFIIIGIGALGPLLLAGVFSGAFISGDRNRANYHTESKGERARKSGWVINLLLISSPNAVVLIVLVVIGLTR